MTDHMSGYIVDSYDIEKVLEMSYNFWTTYINNIYPYKYRLGKVKRYFLDSACYVI